MPARGGPVSVGGPPAQRPWHFLYFWPEPHQHGSLRPIRAPVGVKPGFACPAGTLRPLPCPTRARAAAIGSGGRPPPTTGPTGFGPAGRPPPADVALEPPVVAAALERPPRAGRGQGPRAGGQALLERRIRRAAASA